MTVTVLDGYGVEGRQQQQEHMGPWWYHRHNVCLWKHRSSHAHSVPLLTPSRQIKCQDVSVLLVWPTSQSLFAPWPATGQSQRQGQQTAGAEPLVSRCCAMLHHAAPCCACFRVTVRSPTPSGPSMFSKPACGGANSMFGLKDLQKFRFRCRLWTQTNRTFFSRTNLQ